METQKETSSSLYVHFPFCEAKCHYCDFFSLPESKTADPGRYYSAILKELSLYELAPLRTVFLGGGTPSLVPTKVLAELLARLPLRADTEVTMEANPSSITEQKAREWKKAGVNRVSMGVQALEDARLEWLGRVHGKSQAFAALETLYGAGFERVSTDYILGVPGQTPELIELELEDLLTRFPKLDHLSAYLLTLKPSNPKFKQLPGEEEQLAHLRAAQKILEKHGFEHYEVSNYAKPGRRSRHNQNYWTAGGYLGIGPSAHSFFPGARLRSKNWASLEKYRELVEQGQSPVEWTESLSPEQERLEAILLNLRRKEGLDLQAYRETFHEDFTQTREYWINLFQQKGLCRIDKGRLSLTSEGFYLSDQIISKFS